MSTTYVTLLRHGLPLGEHCFRGHTDFALTDKGFEQMHHSVRNLTEIESVVTSPLKRCADFAYQFAHQHDVSVVEDEEWKEINFGDWDGKEKQFIWQQDQQALSQFWSDPWHCTPPNGETLEAYDLRIHHAWQKLLADHKGKRVLLVTHGGVIKQLFRQIMQMPKSEHYLQRVNIPYAALVNLSVYHDENGKDWPEWQWPLT
ncbi:histidine phosphatase family protein [Vibrio sp. 99-8-1]|uniref:histidine phosphatase family protein n=1 Tax=Vibrio sp. 99-8-1 TaxID=2607602 RepID=UPI0014934FC8|nr:histidine phosphatase family protein [Vibrio sp. 99-8-1]NOI65265.1 histidine phosphatase family protein [Vibrio sp. 99-8-1]